MTIAAIAFDLNGTLLDMTPLGPHFQRLFGSSKASEQWFAELHTLWMTTIAVGKFEKFDQLAKAALQMYAAKERVELTKADQSAILEQMKQLPPFPDVLPGLRQLRAGGRRLFVLTNGSSRFAKAQVKFAGLNEVIEEVFSADQVECYKPAAKPYQFLSRKLSIKPRHLLMVAAHGWDLQGAHAVGLRTAFIARPRQVLNPMATKPDWQVKDLLELPRAISK